MQVQHNEYTNTPMIQTPKDTPDGFKPLLSPQQNKIAASLIVTQRPDKTYDSIQLPWDSKNEEFFGKMTPLISS